MAAGITIIVMYKRALLIQILDGMFELEWENVDFL